jgi:hypothetical protein
MIEVLQSLEPRREQKDTIILNELDEVNELILFNNGTYEIGYEINRVTKYAIKFRNHKVLEAYGATFNKRSAFIYKAHTVCEGFFIRKSNWIIILQNHIELGYDLKKRIIDDYEFNIRNKINVAKKIDLKVWEDRHDYETILVMS